MTSGEPQVWYVKASFGAEWGPMSADTLLEMADSGSLARDDLARCGLEADWQPVPQVLEQLRSPAPAIDGPVADADDPTPDDDSLTSSSLPEPVLEPASESMEPSATRTNRRGALPGWSNYWTPEASPTRPPETAARFLVAELDCHDQATLADHQQFDDAAVSSPELLVDQPTTSGDDSATDQQFAVLNEWKRERTDRLNRLLKIVEDREAAAARAIEAAREAAANESAESEDGATSDSVTSTQPDPARTTAATRPRMTAARTRREPWEQTLNRWKRSLPDGWMFVALLLVPLGFWWFWPTSDASIAETYRLIYDELLELRERPNDKTGMEEFVQRSQAQLNAVIPGLLKRASPSKPAVQWLLWMGRDCLRPMLKNPRQPDTKPEVTFRNLMTEWQRHHGPKSETPESALPNSKKANSVTLPPTSNPARAGKNLRGSPSTKDDSDSDN